MESATPAATAGPATAKVIPDMPGSLGAAISGSVRAGADGYSLRYGTMKASGWSALPTIPDMARIVST